eukprot:207881-Lingulodinium_polyedra.AAC.1
MQCATAPSHATRSHLQPRAAMRCVAMHCAVARRRAGAAKHGATMCSHVQPCGALLGAATGSHA